ncbi:MAG: hypothetical protein ABI972_24485, partial [Acidobacteriota bacterium]
MFRIIAVALIAGSGAFAASERELAEWVIRWEGRVMVEGSRQPIAELSQIPAGSFEITGIDLTGSVMRPVELAKLSGLTTLRELYLPGPVWNPGGGNEDDNEAFQALSGLKSLEKIAFGWHFAAQINIKDSGFKYLLGLTEMKDLRCTQCRLTDINLGSMTKLRSLDLSYSPFNDKGMEGLAGLKNLRRLILRDTMVTDDGLKHLAGLTELEELDLTGTRTSDRGIEFLRGMPKMRKLNLLGARATDASMEIVAGMKHLEVLNLYRTRVTNSGLARLQELKELSDIDLRYSRVTPNGVDS